MHRQSPVVAIVLLFALLYALYLYPRLSNHKPEKVFDSVNDFYQAVGDGLIAEMKVNSGRQQITGTFTAKGKQHYEGDFERFRADVWLNPETAEKLVDLAAGTNTKISFTARALGDQLLPVAANLIIPLAVMVLLWVFFMRQLRMSGGQALSFARSQAPLLG